MDPDLDLNLDVGPTMTYGPIQVQHSEEVTSNKDVEVQVVVQDQEVQSGGFATETTWNPAGEPGTCKMRTSAQIRRTPKKLVLRRNRVYILRGYPRLDSLRNPDGSPQDTRSSDAIGMQGAAGGRLFFSALIFMTAFRYPESVMPGMASPPWR